MSSTSQTPSVTADTVKKTLQVYSKFLRRDFLAILVKMSAKQFGIRTVRSDWRTRNGMINFLAGCWDKFLNAINTDTILQWYYTNFESIEKVFSNRKFMMFIYNNWNQYQTFLKDKETLQFLHDNQLEIENSLSAQQAPTSPVWSTSDVAAMMLKIMDQFQSGRAPIAPHVSEIMPPLVQPQEQLLLPMVVDDAPTFTEVIPKIDEEIEFQDLLYPIDLEITSIPNLELPNVYNQDDTFFD